MARSTALMLLFWIVAALLVASVPGTFLWASPTATVLVKVAAIVAVASGFVKVSRHPASLEGALFVGAVWLLMGTATEIAITIRTAHPWFGLTASPAAPAVRAFVSLAWITAPALFVRRPRTE